MLDLYTLEAGAKYFEVAVPAGTPIFPVEDPKSLYFGNAPLMNWQNYFSKDFVESHMGRRQHYYDLDMVYLSSRNAKTPKWGGVTGYLPGTTDRLFYPIKSLPGHYVLVNDIRDWNSRNPTRKLVFIGFNGDATVPLDFSDWSIDMCPIEWIGPVPTP